MAVGFKKTAALFIVMLTFSSSLISAAQAKYLPPDLLPAELLQYARQPASQETPNAGLPKSIVDAAASVTTGVVGGFWTITVIAPTGERYVQKVIVDGPTTGTLSLPTQLKQGIYAVTLDGSKLVFVNSSSGVPASLTYALTTNAAHQQTNVAIAPSGLPNGQQIVFDDSHRIYSFYFTVTSN